MTIWYGCTRAPSGVSTAPSGGGWSANWNGVSDWETRKNSDQLYMAFDIREIANRYPEYNLSAVQMSFYGAAFKHGWWSLGCTPMGPIAGDHPYQGYPSGYPVDTVRGAGDAAGRVDGEFPGGSSFWGTRRYERWFTWGLHRVTPLSEYRNRPLIIRGDISANAESTSRRLYQNCYLRNIEAWREPKQFPGWASDVMKTHGAPVPGWGSRLVGAGHWMSEARGGREYLGAQTTLPFRSLGWTQSWGRGGGIPGVVWGDSCGYCSFWWTRHRRITGIRIRVSVPGNQGAWGSGVGAFGVQNANVLWNCQENWGGEHTSPWLNCSINEDEMIKVYITKWGDQGDGVSFNWMQIVDVRYE